MAMNCDGEAVLSYGARLRVKDPETGEWVIVGGLTDFNGPQTSRNEIETTTLCSTAKEYALDLKDLGTFTSTMQTRYGDPSQQILLRNMDEATWLEFELLLPDDGYRNGPVMIAFKGRVASFPVQGSPGQVIQTSLSIRITGDATFEFPAAQGPHLTFAPTVLSEAAENDGTVAGVVSVVLHGDTFSGAAGAAQAGVTFNGVPAGLVANTQKISANTIIINFTGAATDHGDGDTASVGVTFADAAFTTGPASAVAGSTGRIITINFAA